MNGTLTKPREPIDRIQKMTTFRDMATALLTEPKVEPNDRITANHIEAAEILEVSCNLVGKSEFLKGLHRNAYDYHKNEKGTWYPAIDTGVPLIELINQKRKARPANNNRWELHWQRNVEDLLTNPNKNTGLVSYHENLPPVLNVFQKFVISLVNFAR
jgi:hypothetical protein